MSIGRRFASSQFTVIMGVIHFMNEYFIYGLNCYDAMLFHDCFFCVRGSQHCAGRMGRGNNDDSPASACRNRRRPPGPGVGRCDTLAGAVCWRCLMPSAPSRHARRTPRARPARPPTPAAIAISLPFLPMRHGGCRRVPGPAAPGRQPSQQTAAG